MPFDRIVNCRFQRRLRDKCSLPELVSGVLREDAPDVEQAAGEELAQDQAVEEGQGNEFSLPTVSCRLFVEGFSCPMFASF